MLRIALSRPILMAGRQISDLSLREPTWGDFEDLSWTLGPRGLSMRTGDVQAIAARLAGLPIEEIRGLSPADGAAIWGALVPFLLGGSPAASEGSPTSSPSLAT